MAKKISGTQKVYEKARAERDENGAAWLEAKDVAVLIRERIKREFPGVKFSVRTDHFSMGNSVDVSWVDGPRPKEVDPIVNAYRFSDFDGMIDMAVSRTNWLLPDGSVTLAETHGTVGSMGVLAAEATDQPAPGAILVKGGAKYVHTRRDLSREKEMEFAKIVAERYGYDGPLVDHRGWIVNQLIPVGNGYQEYLGTLVYRASVRDAEDSLL